MPPKKVEIASKTPAKAVKRRTGRTEALILIGKQLRAVRIASGFSSQDGFAYSCGIDRAYYSALERGERNVGIMKLVQIAAALKVEVGELVPQIEILLPALSSAKRTKT